MSTPGISPTTLVSSSLDKVWAQARFRLLTKHRSGIRVLDTSEQVRSFGPEERKPLARLVSFLAGPPGLEPGTSVLETDVLPLNYRPERGRANERLHLFALTERRASISASN